MNPLRWPRALVSVVEILIVASLCNVSAPLLHVGKANEEDVVDAKTDDANGATIKIRAKVVDQQQRPVGKAHAWLVVLVAKDDTQYETVSVSEATAEDSGEVILQVPRATLAQPRISGPRLIVRDEQKRFGWAEVDKLGRMLQQAARAENGATSAVMADVELDDPIQLVETHDMSLRLLDGAGRPLANVTVKPRSFSTTQFAKYYEQTTRNAYVPFVSLPTVMAAELTVSSHSDGMCTLERVPKEGVCFVQVSQNESSHHVFLDCARDVMVELDTRGQLGGFIRCQDADFNPSLITVSARFEAGPSAIIPTYMFHHLPDTKVKDDGSFQFSELLPGRYTLSAKSADERFFAEPIEPREVDPSGAASPFDVVFTRGVHLRGGVVDEETGEGVAGVWVNLHAADSNSGTFRWSTGKRTGEDGHFDAYAPAGQVYLNVWDLPESFLSTAGRLDPIDVVPQRDTHLLPVIKLVRAAQIKGTVVDGHGQPVPFAEILGHSPDRHDLSTTANAHGEFQLSRIDPDDTLPLRAVAGNAVTNGAFVVDAAKSSGPIKLVVKPEHAFHVQGQVVDSRRNPIVGASVQLLWSCDYVSRKTRLSGTSSVYKTMRTAADGRFRSPPLWAGDRYRVRIVADGFSRHDSAEIEGVTAQTHDYGAIALVGMNNRVAGRVVDSGERFLSGVTVFNAGDAATRVAAQSAVAGQFSLEGLREGTVWVFARHDGFRFAGAATHSGESNVKLTLYRFDEIPPQHAVVPPLSCDDRQRLARHFLHELYTVPNEQRRAVNFLIQRYMAMVDPQQAMQWVGDPENSQFRNDVFMQVASTIIETDPDEALVLIAQVPGGSYFYSVLGMAERVRDTNRALALRLAEDLVLRCRKTDPPNQLYQIAQTGRLLVQLGEREAGQQLLNEAFDAASQLGGAGREPFVRGFTAELLAEFDFEKARQLIDGMKPTTGTSQARHLGNVAANMTSSNPDKAIELAKGLEGRVSVKVAYLLARSNPDRAQSIIDALQGREAARQRAEGLKWLAVALRDTNPTLAYQLIDRSLEVYRSSSSDFDSWLNFGFESVPAAHAAVMARRINYPDVGGAVMQALATRRSPNQQDSEVACLRSAVKMAKFLALADRRTSRLVLEQLDHRPDLFGGGGYATIPRDDWLMAWCLTDPDRGEQLLSETLKLELSSGKTLTQRDVTRVLGWLVLSDDDLHRAMCRDEALWYPGEE